VWIGEIVLYRIAICDDEDVFIKSTKELVHNVLHEQGIAHEITCFTDTPPLLERLARVPNCFDILLLDILLGSENGVELAKKLRSMGSEVSILFTTSSPDFSLEGYSVYPLNYLLKPIQRDQLAKALKKDLQKERKPRTVLLPVRNGNVLVDMHTVYYIETINRLAIVRTSTKEIDCPGPLHRILNLFPPDTFIQCHKSFWVSASKIKDLSRVQITLTDDRTVPVGRAYYQSALGRLIEYMG